ncbi:uncharacterized protein V6R79_022961 [Siganus canaliculatus]
MSVETAVVEEGVNPAQSPLVAVTFQEDANRKLKYLEAKPKALGITQIGLVLFQVNFVIVFMAKGVMDMKNLFPEIPFFICSPVVVIAGSVAVAARNLHVPTLKACLGMQIVACLLSMFNILLSMDMVSYMYFDCWMGPDWDSQPIHFHNICDIVETTNINALAQFVILDVVLVAISITLAVYCCKAIGCCGSPDRTITQIGLVLFQMNFVIVFVAKGVMKMENLFPQIPFFIGSTVVVIAGSVAVAARNLHVPTTTNINVFAELVILDVVLVGISITLARYCCKAIGCCGSPARTPMIALQAPPVQQQGEEANE